MIANKEGGVFPKPSEWLTARLSPGAASTHHTLGRALELTKTWLLAQQREQGCWGGELEGNTILESEYILLLTFLGPESDPVCPACARYIQDHQSGDGGGAIYHGGPSDLSAS